jgi:hypothetical protein
MKSKAKKVRKAKESSKKLVEKAGIAIKNEFYLEATMILSTLFEKRLGKIMEKIEPTSAEKGLTMSLMLRKVRKMHQSPGNVDLSQNLGLELIDGIRTWKNKRNQVLKGLVAGNIKKVRLEHLAGEGIQLYKELTKAAKTLKSTDGLSEVEGESRD